MLAVADEEVYVSVFNTDTYLPSMANCYSKTRDRRSKLWMAQHQSSFRRVLDYWSIRWKKCSTCAGLLPSLNVI
ncbi:hypothetical protein R1flu_009979 [Riccia fluitans]|uniref:Uncharacterized protein n=1 Tax=Riccia fluitans TaxID=41844 RepID=A0ABD1Z7W9_9MARC